MGGRVVDGGDLDLSVDDAKGPLLCGNCSGRGRE